MEEEEEHEEQIIPTRRSQSINPPSIPKTPSDSFKLQKNYSVIPNGQNEYDFYINYLQKDDCTSYFFGLEPIAQQCFVCSLCNPLRNKKMCKYCYMVCHEKCRYEIMAHHPEQEEENTLPIQTFYCACGVINKHMITKIQAKDLVPCEMMKLDIILQVDCFFCHDHNILICAICSVVCHKKCKVTIKDVLDDNEELACKCKSEYHTKYNEIALTFPLEDYKKVTGVKIWPIQILNILFATKTTFSNMSELFTKKLNEFTENNGSNLRKPQKIKNDLKIQFSKEFYTLLELFSNTFNIKFKTYYYHDEMTKMFKYQQLFSFLKSLEIVNSETALTKFRLLFVMLFIHLRRDYQLIKSFTSNDFLCSTVLDRLKFKIFFNSNSVFTDHIEKKYLIYDGHPLKKFALEEICLLMTKGMKFIKVEENQDEFEIGLKFLCFMMKRFLFDIKDLILLIKSLDHFHSEFYLYIMSEKNNIYCLIEIFNCLVELFYMICVNYNDLIIEKYLNEKGEKSFNKNEIGNFIHLNSEYGEMLFRMVLKNCSIITKHFNILKKPEKDSQTASEEKREQGVLEHKLEMQKKILKETTGVKMKLPENGGLFSEKIILLFNETLAIFCLADNNYQKQLDSLTKEDLQDYYDFKKMIKNKHFYDMHLMTPKKLDSNVLYHLKISIETMFLDLFTSSFEDQTRFTEKLKNRLLNGVDEINQALNYLSPPRKDNKTKENSKNPKKDKEFKKFSQKEKIQNFKDKIIKGISSSLSFINHNIFEKDPKNFTQFINLYICSNIDETLMKIMTFLVNRKFPNFLSLELLKLIIDFLSVFLLTRGGVGYFLTGKNLSRIRHLMKHLSFTRENKNIILSLGRTKDYVIRGMSFVIEFLYKILTASTNYGFNLKKHKCLSKIKKTLLIHLHFFSLLADNEDNLIRYKKQLAHTLKIFIILSNDFEYETYEDVKIEIINLFNDSPQNFLNSDNFTKWFNLKENEQNLDELDPEKAEIIRKNRKIDLEIYFSFFKLVSKNTFYIFKNDKYKNNLYKLLFKFNDLEFYKTIFEKSLNITLHQKTILLYFLRTFYFFDILNQVDYINHQHQLTNKEYVSLIYGGYIRNAEFTKHISKQRGKNIETLKAKELVLKYEKSNDLSLVMTLYINELLFFQNFLEGEKLDIIEEYFEEIIFGVKSIGDFFYQEKKMLNKLLPDFYKLVYNFLDKKDLIIYILNNIKNKGEFDLDNYDGGLKDEKIIQMKKKSFDIFDRKMLYRFLQESLFDFFKKSAYSTYSLNNFLEVYDKINEINYTPFSLVETKDFEYFYEEDSLMQEKDEMKDPLSFKLIRLNKKYVEQFIGITNTNFFKVLTTFSNESSIFNYRKQIVDYFQAFLNSTEFSNFQKYQTLLNLVTKFMFYDCNEMQMQFEKMINDPYFFTSFNRQLNYFIVLSISSSKNYQNNNIAQIIINITKLTVQFLQLLGEGFNTSFHKNIFLTNEMAGKSNKKTNLNKSEMVDDKSDNEESESEEISINEELIEAAALQAMKTVKVDEKEIPVIDVDFDIYEGIVQNLKKVYHLMDFKKQIDSDMPFDKLSILTSNLIDFIIEYINTKSNALNDVIKENITNLMFGKKVPKLEKEKDEYGPKYYYKGIISIFKVKIDDKENKNTYITRKKMIALMKIKYSMLLISFLQTGSKNELVNKMISNGYGPFELFLEIIYYFNELIKDLDKKTRNKLASVQNKDEFITILEELYRVNESFRDSFNFAVIVKLFIIIKTLEEMYKFNLLANHFEKVKQRLQIINNKKKQNSPLQTNIAEKEEQELKEAKIADKNNNRMIIEVESPYKHIAKTYSNLLTTNETYQNSKGNNFYNTTNLTTHFNENSETFSSKVPVQSEDDINGNKALKLYQFLDSLIVKVEVKNDFSEETEEDSIKKIRLKRYETKISKKIKNNLKSRENTSGFEEKEIKEENITLPQTSLTFFVRPYLSYYLSNLSKKNFIDNADRTNATSKFVNLVLYTDFFIFEMISNYHKIGANKVFLFLSNIPINLLEIINFLFILLQNIILMIHHYRGTKSSYNDYEIPVKDTRDNLFDDNYYISLIHMVFLVLIILNWLYFKFILCFQRNIMLTYNKNFIFRKKNILNKQNIMNIKIINYFKTDQENIFGILREINKGISPLYLLSTIFLDTFIFNREICFFIFTFVFEFLFFYTDFSLYIVIPIVFIANLTPTLFDILKAFQMKIYSIITTLLFTYITVYLFMWFTFFYLRNLFDFSDVVEVSSGQTITESFCKSSVQCLLFMISNGLRAGGGIGEVLPTVSFYSEPGFFVMRTIYDILFHILLVWILGNVFVGLIVDTFGELRDINWSRENDLNNICFICQISRDECLKKNIDFDEHVKKEHNVWNYVYFLTYLHLSNANDFNRVENTVWEKLIEQDFGWIPIAENDDE